MGLDVDGVPWNGVRSGRLLARGILRFSDRAWCYRTSPRTDENRRACFRHCIGKTLHTRAALYCVNQASGYNAAAALLSDQRRAPVPQIPSGIPPNIRPGFPLAEIEIETLPLLIFDAIGVGNSRQILAPDLEQLFTPLYCLSVKFKVILFIF